MMLLTLEDRGVEAFIRSRSRSTCSVKATGWLRRLQITAGGAEFVSHAGVTLLPALSDASV
jgi:hypothetical protein